MTEDRVLALPASKVQELYRKAAFYADTSTIDEVSRTIERDGTLVGRSEAEATTQLKQVIAYGVLRHGRRVLALKRSRTSNRKSLRLRKTVLFGGHVDERDYQADGLDPLRTCILRELREELGVEPAETPRLIGVVVDPTTLVGRLHLGVIFDVPVQSAFIEVDRSMDGDEFVQKGSSHTYRLETWRELVADGRTWDPWSTLFLGSSLAHELLAPLDPLVATEHLALEWGD